MSNPIIAFTILVLVGAAFIVCVVFQKLILERKNLEIKSKTASIILLVIGIILFLIGLSGFYITFFTNPSELPIKQPKQTSASDAKTSIDKKVESEQASASDTKTSNKIDKKEESEQTSASDVKLTQGGNKNNAPISTTIESNTNVFAPKDFFEKCSADLAKRIYPSNNKGIPGVYSVYEKNTPVRLEFPYYQIRTTNADVYFEWHYSPQEKSTPANLAVAINIQYKDEQQQLESEKKLKNIMKESDPAWDGGKWDKGRRVVIKRLGLLDDRAKAWAVDNMERLIQKCLVVLQLELKQ